MTRAAIYARYSSDNQRDASIEDQVRQCTKELANLNARCINTYTDHAISGSTHLRPGYQRLLEDSRNGAFDVVIAEALDRLSRDQEDVTGLFKQLKFQGIQLITLSEGEITELHVGLKGTMNALYLKDLATKTHRGMEGRVRQGRSGGGRCYGYELVSDADAAGTPENGKRVIKDEEAAIVLKIFRSYRNGMSPNAIAMALNSEHVPGPKGVPWSDTTIYGNWRRGTGILNNELYIGRLIWNRQSFVKDPETGRRVSRPNPEASWIIQEVPELRIVPQDLWDAVKRRQEKNRKLVTKDKREGVRSERARRPVYLLSRLLRCGVCGGSYTIISTTRYGCTNAKTRGTCTNRLTIRRDHLEQTVLMGLKSQLLEPDLLKEFIAEYHRQLNAGQATREAQWKSKEKELARIKQEIGELINAIKAGIHSPTLQTEFDELEGRKAALENELASDPPPPVRLHPNLSEVYRAKVEDLREALNDDKARPEAAEILRSLIDEIRLVPGDGSLQIQLIGHLAEMIALAAKEKPEALEPELQVTLVAGARNHLNLLLVAVGIPRVT